MSNNPVEDNDAQEALNEQLRLFKTTLNTSIPCRVKSVDGDRVTLTLNILRVFNGEEKEALTLVDVPVAFPESSKYGVTFPIEPGDTGIALFQQRSINEWLEGSTSAPKDIRLLDYSDAIYLPGAKPFGGELPTVLTVKADNATVVMKPEGDIDVANKIGAISIDALGNVTIGNKVASIKMGVAGDISISSGAVTISMTPSGSMAITNGTADLIKVLSNTLEVISAAAATVPFVRHSSSTPTPEKVVIPVNAQKALLDSFL